MLKNLGARSTKESFTMGDFKCNRLLSLLPNSFTYGSDTSGWELGNGERGQNTLRGRVNFSEVEDVIPPERIGKSLLGFRS